VYKKARVGQSLLVAGAFILMLSTRAMVPQNRVDVFARGDSNLVAVDLVEAEA
jgi:hypothetical protein